VALILNSDELQEINKIFTIESWLSENFGCDFFSTGSGWLNTSCPFEDHNDNNPSFGINPEEGIYKCFGCSRSGDFFSLVGQLLNLNFAQTIQYMSDYMGLSFESFNTLQHKVERLKKALQEEDQERQRNKKNILKSIFKIKKIQKTDFDKAEKLYEMLDKYVEDNNYSKIAEITNGRIN
jgi:hypothetical protein